MRYWWVNQNQTYAFEVPGGFLWSPKTRADGARNYFYQTMEEVRPGDLVFSYYDTQIQAIGIVQRQAVTAPKPNFRSAGSNWSDIGWYVEVEFAKLSNPVKPKNHMDEIRPLLGDKYAPLQSNGNGLQGIYLTEISSMFGELLVLLSREDPQRLRFRFRHTSLQQRSIQPLQQMPGWFRVQKKGLNRCFYVRHLCFYDKP